LEFRVSHTDRSECKRFVDAFGAVRAGLGGISVVLIAGLLGMLVVRVPVRGEEVAEQPSQV